MKDASIFLAGRKGGRKLLYWAIRVHYLAWKPQEIRPSHRQRPGRLLPAGPHQQPENRLHPARQIGNRHKARPAPSQPWVAEAAALEKMMCLFRETKCPTMNPIRFHRHMKTRSILSTLCKPPATDEYFILSQQQEQNSKQQPGPP